MFFDGKVKPQKVVSGSGKKRETDTNTLLDNARKQRELRQQEKLRLNAAVKLQSQVRGNLQRSLFIKSLRDEFDKQVRKIQTLKALFRNKGTDFQVPLSEITGLVRMIYYFYVSDHHHHLSISSSSTAAADHQRVRDITDIVVSSLKIEASGYNMFIAEDPSSLQVSTMASLQRFFFIVSDEILSLLMPSNNHSAMSDGINHGDANSASMLLFSLESMMSMLSKLSALRSTLYCMLMAEYVTQKLSLLATKIYSNKQITSTSSYDSLVSFFWSIVMTSLSNLPPSSAISNLPDRNLIEKYRPFFENEPWNSVTRNIFTIANVTSYEAFAPYIQQILVAHSKALPHILSSVRAVCIGNCASLKPTKGIQDKLSRFSIAVVSAGRRTASTSSHVKQVSILGNICQYLVDQASRADSVIERTLRSCIQDRRSLYEDVFLPIVDVLPRLPILEAFYLLETGLSPETMDMSLSPADQNMMMDEEYERNETTELTAETIVGIYGLERCLSKLQTSTRRARLNQRDICSSVIAISTLQDTIFIIKFFLHPSTLTILLELIPSIPTAATAAVTEDPQTQLSSLITEKVLHIYYQLIINTPFLDSVTAHQRTAGTSSYATALLNTLAFASPSNPLSRRIFNHIQSLYPDTSLIFGLQSSIRSGTNAPSQATSLSESFHVFLTVYQHQLSAMDDHEFFNLFDHSTAATSFSMDEIVQLILCLKQYLYEMFYAQPTTTISSSSSLNLVDLANRSSSIRDLHLLSKLYANIKFFNSIFYRYERRAFASDSTWHWNFIATKELESSSSSSNPSNPLHFILPTIPQVIPFHQRLKIFKKFLEDDRDDYLNLPNHAYGIQLQVRRDSIIEDTYTSKS
jgi:hypothetical protein